MRTLFFWHMFWEKWENPRQHVNNFWMRLFHRLMNYVISFQQMYVIKFWEPSNVLILSNYKILLAIPDKTCINFEHMVYYIYELRWASSDNTLKELDASGSFLIELCNWWYCIGNTIQYFLLLKYTYMKIDWYYLCIVYCAKICISYFVEVCMYGTDRHL